MDAPLFSINWVSVIHYLNEITKYTLFHLTLHNLDVIARYRAKAHLNCLLSKHVTLKMEYLSRINVISSWK